MMSKTMTAARLYAPGDLRVETVDLPKTDSKKNVLIQVMAAGVCGSDLDRIIKTGTYSFPTIPGHEFAGLVVECPEGCGFQKGDRVAAAPLLPCFTCEFCQSGSFGQCNTYDFLGSRCDGAFAQYVTVPLENLVRLPDGISFEEAAAIEPAAITLHGMKKVGIEVGDTVAVLGCGGVGLFAIQFAKIMGATKIIAVDIAEDKLELARKMGATHTLSGLSPDIVFEIQQLSNGGVDAAIETAGVSITQEQCLRITRKLGRILYLGTAHRDVVIPPQSFERIVRNELQIVGSWNSYSAPFPGNEWTATIDYLAQGRLDIRSLITHVLPLSDAPNIISDMAQRKFQFCKVLFAIEQ